MKLRDVVILDKLFNSLYDNISLSSNQDTVVYFGDGYKLKILRDDDSSATGTSIITDGLLANNQHKEIQLVFPAPLSAIGGLVIGIADCIHKGRVFSHGDEIEVDEKILVKFVDVPEHDDRLRLILADSEFNVDEQYIQGLYKVQYIFHRIYKTELNTPNP